jgi:hypothetical protein
VSARVRRWCGWFLAARWPLDEVAALFDLHPADLAAAVGRAHD